ncbi:ADP-forming succinate--CoA ligase subunit beta [Sporolactobacillus shoreae]|uniref:Succinate--CoA ligase [ADP-forming] subunit beta n=1 Tax=Sporolactobacillus shoreae TaxID=1465501 RepID=A0A4Z0GUN1_9BACL|nr:ADP-forming succinate--CoA ligase subunit beta [Sporolactobacillus shoreae]TGB00267.1 ADP-forming succinate--CoA ligase subunit beta [Sporolactobacillus shoreae]
MNIHEYQGKQLLKKYGVAVPLGNVAFTPEQAIEAAKSIHAKKWVVKAQIHAGGRGKAGGVKIAGSLDQITPIAEELLGKILVTPQTGPAGKKVKRLLIEEGSDIEKEFYLGMVLDRNASRIAVIASSEGGMEIEEVASKTPEKIVRESVDPLIGLAPFQARRIAFGIGIPDRQVNKAVKFMLELYRAFVDQDCSIAEINPLVLTKSGEILALDTKLNFDDNGLYRHKELLDLRDLGEEDEKEIQASEYGLNYIALDGNIGCMVNGAGLAMATMDIIKAFNGDPANFLDVGGGASKEKVEAAFRLILSDPHVRGILVNIFGGIMKCDVIAEGIVAATENVGLKVPLVVRLEGTNVKLGKEILHHSGLNITSANTMADAAEKIVQLVDQAAGGVVK